MFCRSLRPFLMCLFNAVESNGFNSSKLQSNSEDTDMTAPQLSNSPQYYISNQCHVKLSMVMTYDLRWAPKRQSPISCR